MSGSTTRNSSQLIAGSGAGPLLLSMRRVNKLVACCINYEFEDVIAELTGADRDNVGGWDSLESSRRRFRMARMMKFPLGATRTLARGNHPLRLERDYGLFFPIFNGLYELHALTTIPNWHKRSRLAACYVSEAWLHLLPGYLIETRAEFDHVFIGMRNPAEAVGRLAGRPCTYLPLASDVLRFSPFPRQAARTINFCNIGRRSQVTHAALLQLTRERNIFYYHDTVAASGIEGKQLTIRVQDAAEHREQLARLLRRSRFYLTNKSLVSDSAFRHGRVEISGRFYDGIAAGAAMIGEPPECEDFERQFDWPDAVIERPFDDPSIANVIADLDRDPERLKRIGTANFRQAALRHDWVHRLLSVYQTLGLAPTSSMLDRVRHLRDLATLAAAAPPHMANQNA